MSEHSEVLDLPVNCKIRFETPEGDYEGSVMSTTHSGFIEVDSTLLPDEDYLGKLRFHFSEILKYQILDTPAVTESENTFGRVNCKQSTVDGFDNSDDDLDSISVSFEDQDEPVEYIVKLPPAFTHLPTDLMIIDQLGGNFENAIDHLKNEPDIGLNLEGNMVGRYGTLSWLCVSTSKTTFLFDAYKLGCDLFDHGMRDIMQDANIVKVIHDCRLVSDMFLHKYETKLVNVFDTQVADKYVETQRKGPGQVHPRASSLNGCLRQFLNIPEEFLYRPKGRRFDHLLFYRPPNDMFLDVMIKNVIYLRSLKEQLEDCMLEQFQEAVETNLQTVRSATDEELLLGVSVPERLPSDVTAKGIVTIKSNHYHKSPADASPNPLENKRSGFFHNLQKYSEGRWSESCEFDETFPINSSTFEDVLPTCTSKTLQLNEVKNSLYGSISDQTTPNCDAKLECSPMPKTSIAENFVKALSFRGTDYLKYQAVLSETFKNGDVQQSPVCSSESPNFQDVMCSPVPNETVQKNDVQLKDCLQTNEGSFESYKFQGKNHSPNITTLNETGRNGDTDLKCSKLPESANEFLNFQGRKGSPVSDDFTKNDIQHHKLLPPSSISCIPYVSDSMESEQKSDGSIYSDISLSEDIKDKAFDCFSSESHEFSNSEEDSEQKESIPYDPWERIKSEMSEDISPIDTNRNLKYKFVPAGQLHY